MTFFEAAIAVLRAAGRPLHYKKITEIAIRRDLLSHVGKTPELTMGARLGQEVRKDAEGSPLIRTRPGVFGLRGWETGQVPTLAEVRETIRLYAGEGAAEAELVLSAEEALDEEADASAPGEGVEEGRRRRRRQQRQQEEEEVEAAAAEAPAAEPVEAAEVQASAAVAPPVWSVPSSSLTLADGVASLLQARFDDPDGVPEQRLAEALLEQGLAGELDEITAQLRPVLLADNASRQQRQQPPRFEHNGRGSWRRSAWSMGEGARGSLERMDAEAEGLRQASLRAVERWLGQLPAEGLAALVEVLMPRLGVSAWEVISRSSGGVVVRYTSGPPAPGVRVLALALGALPEVPEVSGERWAAVVVEEGAEAVAAGLSAQGYQLLPREEVAGWLVRLGIGVRVFQAPVVLEDAAFFLALGAAE